MLLQTESPVPWAIEDAALRKPQPELDIFFLDRTGSICAVPPIGQWSMYRRQPPGTVSFRQLILLEFGQSGYYLCMQPYCSPLTFGSMDEAMRFLIPEPTVPNSVPDTAPIFTARLASIADAPQVKAASFYRSPSKFVLSFKKLVRLLGQLQPTAFDFCRLSPEGNNKVIRMTQDESINP